MRKPFLTFDRVAAGMAVAIAIVATLAVTLPTGAGVVSAPSGSLSAAGVATNKILRTAADGTLTDVIIGSGLSMGADGTLSSSGGGGGGGGGAPAVGYVALPTSGIVGGSQLGYSTNLSALSVNQMLVPTNLFGTNRYLIQWYSAGQSMIFSNSPAWYFTDGGRGAWTRSRTNAGFHELQLWKDDVSGRTNALYSSPEYSIAVAGGATLTTNDLTGTVTITTGGTSATTAYAAIPQSGGVGSVFGGTNYATNLSANLLLSPVYTTDTPIKVQVTTLGYVLTISNAASINFLDAGRGAYPQLSTNGITELTVWVDAVSGQTNAIVHGPQYSLAATDTLRLSSNNALNQVTLSMAPSFSPSFGALPASAGTSTLWSFGTPNGRWVINEEFWTPANDSTHGSEIWNQSRTGTYVLTNNGATGFGLWNLSLRTALSRYAIWAGSSTIAAMRLTNSEVFFQTRVYTSMLDGAGDTNTVKIGFGDSASAEFSNGIYFRSTNNVWELVTARGGARTVTANSSAAVQVGWQDLAFYLDSTGTNVFAYVGTSSTNMACVATNSANIPHDTLCSPMIYFQRGLTNTTAGMTNIVDYYRLWAKHQ